MIDLEKMRREDEVAQKEGTACRGCGRADPCGYHYHDCPLLEDGDVMIHRNSGEEIGVYTEELSGVWKRLFSLERKVEESIKTVDNCIERVRNEN